MRTIGLLWAVFLIVSTWWAPSIHAEEHKFRLMLTKRIDLKPSSRIRVRVFPHTKRYKPHGRDAVMNRVSLTSDAPCSVYPGKVRFPGMQSKNKISENQFQINLSADSLDKPLYVRCAAPIKVVREKAETNFTYKGDMYARLVKRSGQKVIELINIVTLKDYLKGVVPSEVYSSWPMETLKTQAVAARTYSVFHINFARRYLRKKRVWDVDDTIAYQAYTGISLNTKRTNYAVDSTEGQILTHNGAVIQAYYHADSGGQTEDAADVWDLEIPYVKGRKENFDFNVAGSSWTKTVSLKSIERRLRRKGQVKGKQRLTGLSVPAAGRTESGRVKKIVLEISEGENRIVDVLSFKKLAGNLPSTLFAFTRHERDPRYFKLQGMGSGHGVGMSQQGAAILADEKGWGYGRILDYYYTDTTLCRLHKKGNALPNCYGLAKKVTKKKAIKPSKSSS